MAAQIVHLELLLGKQVVDQHGEPIGRLYEVRAEQQGDEWVIRDYLIGETALLERLSAQGIGQFLRQMAGASMLDAGYIVPWDQIDLSDPEHPRLRCAKQDLQRLPVDEQGHS